MLQNYSRYRALQEFFDFPSKSFQMRELSRKIKLAQPSVIKHLKALVKAGFLVKEKKGIYPTFRANRDDEIFKLYKRCNLLYRIQQGRLLEHIWDCCLPDAIVLFGSASKGEDLKESDIDLFVQSPQKKLELVKYEKQLNRKIAIFFEENFSRLSPELKNNVLNGIVLKGYLKVF